MDEDDDGLVSRREFRRSLRKANRKQENPDETLTNERLNEIFDILDENNYKDLNFEDIKKANDHRRAIDTGLQTLQSVLAEDTDDDQGTYIIIFTKAKQN